MNRACVFRRVASSLLLALGWEQAAHLISNCLTNINFTDMEIWYQAFPRYRPVHSAEEHPFCFEPGITGKVGEMAFADMGS